MSYIWEFEDGFNLVHAHTCYSRREDKNKRWNIISNLRSLIHIKEAVEVVLDAPDDFVELYYSDENGDPDVFFGQGGDRVRLRLRSNSDLNYYLERDVPEFDDPIEKLEFLIDWCKDQYEKQERIVKEKQKFLKDNL